MKFASMPWVIWRLLRRAIIHNKGKLAGALHQQLKVFKDLFEPDTDIQISHDCMHQVFVRSKQVIGKLILDHVGKHPGAPEVGEIKDVAIQRTEKNSP
jgi:hypothetical protein